MAPRLGRETVSPHPAPAHISPWILFKVVKEFHGLYRGATVPKISPKAHSAQEISRGAGGGGEVFWWQKVDPEPLPRLTDLSPPAWLVNWGLPEKSEAGRFQRSGIGSLFANKFFLKNPDREADKNMRWDGPSSPPRSRAVCVCVCVCVCERTRVGERSLRGKPSSLHVQGSLASGGLAGPEARAGGLGHCDRHLCFCHLLAFLASCCPS